MKCFKRLRVNLLKEAVKRMEELTEGAILDGNIHTQMHAHTHACSHAHTSLNTAPTVNWTLLENLNMSQMPV